MRRHTVFDRDTLEKLANERADEYRNASPFPHIVLDGVVPDDVVQQVVEEFPGPGDIQWTDKTHEYSRKSACNNLDVMGPGIRSLLFELNSGVFIDFLEKLTGIDGIIPDPHLEGGGMHQIQRGGFLEVHADFNYHKRLMLQRRLNLLLYLNDDWPEEYGGHLELWATDLRRCERKILPVRNRMVIFSTTDKSYHGHPEPMSCPEERTRNSLALYYYTKDRPGNEISEPHSTLYRGDAAGTGNWMARKTKQILGRLWGST